MGHPVQDVFMNFENAESTAAALVNANALKREFCPCCSDLMPFLLENDGQSAKWTLSTLVAKKRL